MSEPPVFKKILRKEKGNIWVVEDEEDVRDLLGEQLEMQGYSPVLIRDGYEFLKAVKENRRPVPDSIICDWHLESPDKKLPRIDAPAILRIAEQYFPQTPVLVVTGWHKSLDDLHKVMLHGARAFLPKPYTTQELFEKLSTLVGLRNLQAKKMWPANENSGNGEKNGRETAQSPQKKRVGAGKKKNAEEKKAAPAAAESDRISGDKARAAPRAGGVSLPLSLAFEIEPDCLVPSDDVLEDDVIREYALSFEDLITDFEEDLLALERYFESGELENFAEAFEVSQKSYRALHTLKGNAGFLKADYSQKLIHGLEDILGDARSNLESLDLKLVQRLIDHFLAGKDVLSGICRFMERYNCEAGYETTPAYRLYEQLLVVSEVLAGEIREVAAGAKKGEGNFDDMF